MFKYRLIKSFNLSEKKNNSDQIKCWTIMKWVVFALTRELCGVYQKILIDDSLLVFNSNRIIYTHTIIITIGHLAWQWSTMVKENKNWKPRWLILSFIYGILFLCFYFHFSHLFLLNREAMIQIKSSLMWYFDPFHWNFSQRKQDFSAK